MNIRTVDRSDLPLVARCHIRAFPESFTARLGEYYLDRMFAYYLQAPNVLIGAFGEAGICLGYCGGIVGYGATSGMLQFAFWQGALALLSRPWLILHPQITSNWRLILRNLSKRFTNQKLRANHLSTVLPRVRSAGLVVIGVDPESRGKGIGSGLIKAFESRAFQAKCSEVRLSVKSSNTSALQFYERNGWERYSSNSSSHSYRKRFSNSDTSTLNHPIGYPKGIGTDT